MGNVIDLGLIQALHKGAEPPENPDLLWLDTATGRHRYYDPGAGAWLALARERQEFLKTADDIDASSGQVLIEHTLADPRPLLQVIDDATGQALAYSVIYYPSSLLVSVGSPFVATRFILRS